MQGLGLRLGLRLGGGRVLWWLGPGLLMRLGLGIVAKGAGLSPTAVATALSAFAAHMETVLATF